MNYITNFTVGEFIGYISIIVAALSVVVQVSPIKINPWSWIAKKIGKAINGEMIEKVEKIEQNVSVMQDKMDENSAKQARSHILRFGDEILHGVRHSKEHFDEILNSITEYTQYCDTHPKFKNHMTDSTTKHILNTYYKCMENNDFL